MSRNILGIVFFAVLAILTARQTWGASGYFEVLSPTGGVVCGETSVVALFHITDATGCQMSYLTWELYCGEITITKNGEPYGGGAIKAPPGGGLPTSQPIGIDMKTSGTVQMVATSIEVYFGEGCYVWDGCIREGPELDSKSVDVRIDSTNPCCGNPTCGNGPNPGPSPIPSPGPGPGPGDSCPPGICCN